MIKFTLEEIQSMVDEMWHVNTLFPVIDLLKVLVEQNKRLKKLAFADLSHPLWCLKCPCSTGPATCRRQAYITCKETLLKWAMGEFDE